MAEQPPADDADACAATRAAEENALDDIQDGAGCTELWEHLSEHRDEDESDEE
jgi:hypothetical protein